MSLKELANPEDPERLSVVSFQEKLHDLQHENQLLKTMITDLNNNSNIANEMAKISNLLRT